MLINKITKISLTCIGLILFNSFLLATLFHYIFLIADSYYFRGYAYNFLNNFGTAIPFIIIAVIIYLLFHIKKKQWTIIGGLSPLICFFLLANTIGFGTSASLLDLLFFSAIFFVGWLAAYITKKLLLMLSI